MRNWMALLLFSWVWAACSFEQTNSYYLDATTGNDTHDGRSPERAWQSLERLNRLPLKAGDKIWLKRGEQFTGKLEISGQGSAEHRIYIDAYGTSGQKPCIRGNDTASYAVRIYNSDYITLQNIEIVNTGKHPLPHRTGLKIESRDYGVSHQITVKGVTIRDVNGSLVKEQGGGCGIYIVNGGRKSRSRFDHLTIENCHILRCSRNGMIWDGYSDRQEWYPNTHTVIRGNLIEEVPGDGIVPIGCDSTLIEYNVMRNSPDLLPATEAAAGIWPWSCDNTLIQFNEVSDHKAPWDAQGFDSDWNCRGTVIQYNYSHDNYGGLVLICNSGEAPPPSNIGNWGTVVRYNISINDGIRPKSTRIGMFSPAIHLAGPVKETEITNNIIHLNPKPTREMDRTMLTLDSWGGYPDQTTLCGNIFYCAEVSRFNWTQSTNNHVEANYYIGQFTTIPADKQANRHSALYQREVVAVDANGFGGLTQLLDTTTIANKQQGVFVNREAIEHFFKRIEEE